MLNLGILIIKKISIEIVELEELTLYSLMYVFIISIPLLIGSAI